MSAPLSTARPPAAAPSILLVDDDRRVVELLEIAFTAHGFKVTSAADGDEALKHLLTDKPDLVVLDLRLPKKSGLEVCEWLRKDPDDPNVPVIVVSAVVDTDTRLQAFTRGADDYLTKPFSPKELIARVKRLLARSAEAREARERQRLLEHDAARAREDARRAHLETQRGQRLTELAFGPGLDLLRAVSADELGAWLLPAVRSRLGAGMAGLLLPEHGVGALVAAAVRGDGPERLASLALQPGGALTATLAGLERPVARADLERFPDLREETAPFVACGVTLLVPLRGPEGLEGLVVTDERPDGLAFPAPELEALAGLARMAGVALHNARRVRALVESVLDVLAARDPGRGGSAGARAEAAYLAEHAARATLLPPRQRGLLAHAVRLGRGATPDGDAALERLAGGDPTGLVRDLRALLRAAAGPGAPAGATPDERRAATLLAVALAFGAARAAGSGLQVALQGALDGAGDRLDPLTRQALEAAARELTLAAA